MTICFRIRCLFLSMLLLALAGGAAAQTAFPVSKVDPAPEGLYPGNRGPDELVVYTPAYGRATTGTNQYGAEAIVRDGVVESVGGNNRPIPEDGYVISGHGRASMWVNRTLQSGMAVEIAEGEVRIDNSPPARARVLLFRLREMAGRLAADDAETSASIAAARGELQAAIAAENFTNVARLRRRVDNLANRLWQQELAAMESPEGEIRGAWHRLTQTTPEALAQLAEDLAAGGINVFFPETIYGSQAIFTDETGLYPRFPQFGETDALAVLIEECHRRGIQVHAWVHCFFVGIEGSTVEPPLLAMRHPEWLARDRHGRTVSEIEPNFMYINPAMPEVRRALIDAYVALAKNYAIDGFQFDYIRYCSAPDWRDGWDYSDFTRRAVREQLGFDPKEIAPDSHPEQWRAWLGWREAQVTGFVVEAAEAIRAVRPDIVLTADVFPNIAEAIENKGQNWADWGRRGYVDALIPMQYTSDAGAVVRSVEELEEMLPAGMPLVVGLGPFLGLTTEQIIEQVLASRRAGSRGQVMFSWDTMPAGMRESLAAGPWRSKTEARWKGEE